MALPVQNPTYLLAPNWTFRPDGPIALGNIIANPLKPHIVLSRPDQSVPQPPTTTIEEKDWKLADNSGRKLSTNLWASFLETIQFKIGAKREKTLRTEYTVTAMETRYFRDGVTSELVLERAKDPVVRALMKPDSILSKPVFMITGIKIAKGLHLSSAGASVNGGQLGLAPPSGGPVSGGGDGEFEVNKARDYSFESDNVVFAYQLLKMAPKGWGDKRKVRGTEYQSSASFLSDEGVDGKAPSVEIEFGSFQSTDLEDLGVANDRYFYKVDNSATNEDEKFSYVAPKET